MLTASARAPQLKMADHGRAAYSKRVRKQAPAERPQRLAPLTSERVGEADDDFDWPASSCAAGPAADESGRAADPR